MGLPDNTMTTIAGILGDMTVDPTTFGAMKPVFKTIGKMGSMSVELASKVPNIEKGIEAIKKSFNIFYDIEKQAIRKLSLNSRMLFALLRNPKILVNWPEWDWMFPSMFLKTQN